MGLIFKKNLSSRGQKSRANVVDSKVILFESGIDLPDFRDVSIKIILSDVARTPHSAPSENVHPCDETLRHVATFA